VLNKTKGVHHFCTYTEDLYKGGKNALKALRLTKLWSTEC